MSTLLMIALLVGCRGGGDPPPPGTSPTSDPTADTATTTDTFVDDGIHDPLSMPWEPTLDPSNFNSASECVSCHPVQFEDWQYSNHAYSMVDPVYQSLLAIRQADFDGAQDLFCTQCHSAIGVRGGDILEGFSFDELLPITMEGITCESCHKISGIVRTHNAGHELDELGPMRGPIQDPVQSAYHDSQGSDDFDKPDFCGSCHDVIELTDLNLERPYEEFLESPANVEGVTCQDCHMPSSTGPAAVGGPDRELHQHRWVGVDIPMLDGFLTTEAELRFQQDVAQLMQGAATLQVQAPAQVNPGAQLDLVLTVTNNLTAHNLPTGTTFIRQMWLEVTATDANGVVLYQTGDLDANGDLRNFYSELDPYGDADLISFSSSLVAADGSPELFPWRASEHFSNSIPPLYDRTYTLFVPTSAEVVGPITIDSRVRFRSHPPFLLRALGLPELQDKIEVYDLDVSRVEVAVSE